MENEWFNNLVEYWTEREKERITVGKSVCDYDHRTFTKMLDKLAKRIIYLEAKIEEQRLRGKKIKR